MTSHSDLIARFDSAPLDLLVAELHRRQSAGERPTCGSANRAVSYNFPLHLFALFLILFLSTAACCFPLVVRRFPALPVPHHALFLSRHFGTGVLIATAFVHLFPTAYTHLTNPCLPPFWTDVYPAMAGFMAMVSVLVVVAIEMFFAARGAGHSHHVDFEQLRTSHTHGGGVADRRGRGSFTALRRLPDGADRSIPLAAQRSPFSDVPLTPQTPTAVLNKPLPSPPREEEDEDRYEDEDDLDLDELEHDDARPLTRTPDSDDDDDGPDNGHARKPAHRRNISWADHTPSPTDPHQQRLVLQCLMLEAGILFHSVFIGLALSVSVGSSFIVLLIAISFHQTFEGLALGSRIAGIPAFSTTSLKPWAMSLMYGVTTPIGQAIGLGVQGLYDPASELGLLMVGIMNAISAGLLLYAGLVQLLAEDFLTDKSYEELRGVRRLQACGAVVAGCMLMALVGVWA